MIQVDEANQKIFKQFKELKEKINLKSAPLWPYLKSGKRKFFGGNDLAEMSFFRFRFLGDIRQIK